MSAHWMFKACLATAAICCLTLNPPSSARAAENPEASLPAIKFVSGNSNEFQEARRALQDLEEQLRSATQALEQARRESEAAVRRNNEALAERLAAIEKALATQRDHDQGVAQKSNRIALAATVTFATVGIVMVLLTMWFQARSLQRLAEIAALHRELPVLPPSAGAALPIAADTSGHRLLGALENLEKRLHDLEHTTQAPLSVGDAPKPGNQVPDGNKQPPANSQKTTNATANAASSPSSAEKQERINLLLGKGQSLFSTGQLDKALECFNEAIALDPNHAEALMKKGTVLEKQEKLEAALEFYDRALEVNSSLTLAYLYKGGVYNLLERFDEALECYEKALHTQQLNAGNGATEVKTPEPASN